MSHGYCSQPSMYIYISCVTRLEITSRNPRRLISLPIPIFSHKFISLSSIVFSNVCLYSDYSKLVRLSTLKSIHFIYVEFSKIPSTVIGELSEMVSILPQLETLAVVNSDVNLVGSLQSVFLLFTVSDSLTNLFWYPPTKSEFLGGYELLVDQIDLVSIDRLCILTLLDVDWTIFDYLSSPKSYIHPHITFDSTDTISIVSVESFSLRLAKKPLSM